MQSVPSAGKHANAAKGGKIRNQYQAREKKTNAAKDGKIRNQYQARENGQKGNVKGKGNVKVM